MTGKQIHWGRLRADLAGRKRGAIRGRGAHALEPLELRLLLSAQQLAVQEAVASSVPALLAPIPAGLDNVGSLTVSARSGGSTDGTVNGAGASLSVVTQSIVVNSTAGTQDGTITLGHMTLPDAVSLANSATANTAITFDPVVFATKRTITLSSGLTLSNTAFPTSLTGPAAGVLISGGGAGQQIGVSVFPSVVATMSGLSITQWTQNAIWNQGSVTLLGSSIYGNTSTTTGAGISNAGKMTLIGDTISNNSENGYGAAGVINRSIMTAINVTVAGNVTTGFAGGVMNYGGTLTLYDDTISGNVGNDFGGGLYSWFGGSVTIGNTIIAGNRINTANGSDVSNASGAIISKGNNLIGIADGSNGWTVQDYTGTAASPLAATLTSLAACGNNLQVLVPLANSFAIDHGSNALIPSGITTDERGGPRTYTTTVDIGAVETQPVGGSITGVVFSDGNANGLREGTESGLSGATVFADTNNNGTWDNGEVAAVTTSNGTYTLTGLPPGNYTVRTILQSGYLQTTSTSPAPVSVTIFATSTGPAIGERSPDLGVLPGDVSSVATATNASGQVVGYSQAADGTKRAFLYSNGVLSALGTLPGDIASAATAINDNGQVTGYSESAGGTRRPFLYSNGVMTNLTPQANADAQIYVATSSTTLGEYSTTGATLAGSIGSGPIAVRNMAVSDSYIYTGYGVVQKYSTSGAVVSTNLIPGITQARAIAVSGSYLFVADLSGTIGEYTTSGATVNASLITGLNDPTGIAVVGPLLFVTEQSGNVVAEFSTTGAVINPAFLNLASPVSIAASGANLYVAWNFNTIGEFTTSGLTINASLITGLATPQGIAISGSSLFVTNFNDGIDSPDGYVSKYTTSGALVTHLLISGMRTPYGIGTYNGNLFVASQQNGQIGEYTFTGNLITPSLVPGFDSPSGIAISGPNLFITNQAANTIGVYSRTGAPVNVALVSGLQSPGAICATDTDLFVVNTGTGNIGRYTLGGATVNANLISGLTNPVGIALSGSFIFVVDKTLGTVAEYTTSGLTINPTLVFGLNQPTALAVSGSRLYVTNSGNGSVGVYTLSGAAVNAALISGLQGPSAISVSGSNIFVLNQATAKLGKYTISGGTVNASLVSGVGTATALAIAAGNGTGTGINNNGQVVGFTQDSSGSSYAFLSAVGSLTNLGTLPGALYSYANAINNLGQIVGYAKKADGTTQAFIYNNGKMTALGNLSGGVFTVATAINASGQVVGYSGITVDSAHPFLYDGGGLVDLGLLPGAVSGYATGINSAGQVVGYSQNTRSGTEAFFYSNGSIGSLNHVFVTNTPSTIGDYTSLGGTINTTAVTGIYFSYGMAVLGSNLFVDNNNHSGALSLGYVGQYTLSGADINQTFLSDLPRPRAIAIYGSSIFVEGLYAIPDSYIYKYDMSGAQSPNFTPIRCGFTARLTVTGGNVFVVSGSVTEYTTDGALVSSNLIPSITSASDIASYGGKLYILNDAGTVGVYDTNGNAINASLITGLKSGSTIAIAGGILFATNGTSGSVAEYSLAGTLLNPSLVSGLSAATAITAVGEFMQTALSINENGQILGQGYNSSGILNAQLYSPSPPNPSAVLISTSGNENAGALNRGSLPTPIPYSTAGAIGPTGTYKWTQAGGLTHPVYISYSFANLLDGSLGGSLSTNQIVKAAQDAMAVWASIAPLNFVEVADSGPDPTIIGSAFYPSAFNPMIRFGRRSLVSDIALTTQPYSATNGQSGDINLNTSTGWSLDPAAGFDLREVFLHEIGLALGLNEDTAHPASIMSGYTGRFPANATPSLNVLDVTAIQGVYGSGVGGVYPLFTQAIGMPIAQASGLAGLTVTGVSLFDVPAGTTFSAGSDQGNGTWFIAPYQLSGLMVAPPANYHGRFIIPFTANISDGTTRQGNVVVNVSAVAYAPTLVVAGPAQGDAATPIYLPIEASFAVPTDSDGVLGLKVSGVPANATVSGGTFVSSGVWAIDPANVNGFSITPALGSGSFTLQVTATDTQISDGASASATLPLSVIVVPVVADAFETADNMIAKATYLPLHTLQSHSIFPAGDADWYTFNVSRDNSEVDLFARSPNDASAPLVSNLTLTLYSDAAGTVQIGQATGELAMIVPAGQYYLRVTSPVVGGVANYTIQLGITDPSAIAPVLQGTALATGHTPDYYDNPSNGVNDNTLNPGVPTLVPGNQLDAGDVARAIYTKGDVDWAQFTVSTRSLVTLQAYVPFPSALSLLGSTTTGNSTIVINASDVSMISQLAVGMTVASTGVIGAGTTIVSISTANHSITLSQNPIGNSTQARLDFQLVLAGNVLTGSKVITGIPSTAALSIGMNVFGTGIPSNCSITSIGSDNHSITLSSNATVTQAGDTLKFVPLPPIICVFNGSTASQMTNLLDTNSAFPSVQGKFQATLAPGTYYALVYYYNNGGAIPSYDLNLSLTPTSDTTQATASIAVAGTQNNPTLGSTVAFVAQFSKPVTGLTGAGLVLPAGVGVSITPVNPSGGFATTFNILATGITSVVAVNIGINANAARDASGNPNAALAPSVPVVYVGQSSLAGEYLFYKGSAFDTGSHDNAIAPDKTALLPGHTASFANYSSYSRGINGVMLDITNLPASLSASDFTFKVGNNNAATNWALAPAPLSVTTRTGQGIGGSSRIEIIWADNVIQNQWLQVTVKGGAGSTSALPTDTVFYFGNAIGDTGDSPSDAQVTSFDEIGARFNAANLSSQSTVTALSNVFDFNRDKFINSADEALAGANYTNFVTALNLIGAPLGAAPQIAELAGAVDSPPAAPADSSTPPADSPSPSPVTEPATSDDTGGSSDPVTTPTPRFRGHRARRSIHKIVNSFTQRLFRH